METHSLDVFSSPFLAGKLNRIFLRERSYPRFEKFLNKEIHVFASLSTLIKHFAPTLSLYLMYEIIGGLINPVYSKIDWFTPANFERLIFGNVLSIIFQQHRTSFLDNLFTVIYVSHPFYLFLLSIILYKKDRDIFKQFSRIMVITCYVAFLIFLIYPAAPPWLATRGVDNIPRTLINNFYAELNIPITYEGLARNLYAAVPSLHCALAWNSVLCIRKMGKKYGVPMFCFTVSLWLATIYTGNHFFLDIVLGILLASIVHVAFGHLSKRNHSKSPKVLRD